MHPAVLTECRIMKNGQTHCAIGNAENMPQSICTYTQ